jgi:glucose/arabinose dehydrogenase
MGRIQYPPHSPRDHMHLKRIAAFLLGALMLAGCGTTTAAASGTLVDIGAGLQGPAGLHATVYAQGLASVAAIAVDDRGRLWIATADYTDSGKDGLYLVAASSAVPVEIEAGLHSPLGLVWADGTLYVSSTGGVTAYGGFDGTRFATQNQILTLAPGVGEVNGLALDADGRLWLGISAPCDHCTPTAEYSASVISFGLDGSDVRVEASGIRAPVGLVYDAADGHILVTMNQRDDLGSATPGDWLAVVERGQAWGFPDCYGQGGAACTGVPAPAATLDAHAAVGGVAIVRGQLGTTVGTSAIVAEWALGKVQRVALEASGTTAAGTVSPFLTGIKSPMPVLLGPDGALFVGDWATGTVYRIAA